MNTSIKYVSIWRTNWRESKIYGAGDDEVDPVDEYSSQSSSSDFDADTDEEAELRNQNWLLLRTTRSGWNISVNQKYGL